MVHGVVEEMNTKQRNSRITFMLPVAFVCNRRHYRDSCK